MSRILRAASMILALTTVAALAATPAGAGPADPGVAVSPAGPDEQNSPVQAIPAPADALYGMLGRPATTLRPGTPQQAGLLPGPIERIPADVEAGMLPQGTGNHPLFPGAVSLVGHNGRVVERTAHGYAVLYSDDVPTLLPPDQRVPTRTDTIYDLASLSKLFTSIVAMQLVDQHRLDLDAPVVRYLPAFAAHGKTDITIAQLLTHTSGLLPDPVPALWTLPPDQRVNGILDTTPEAPAGSEYKYSDINLMTMALVEQAITGATLDVLVHDWITGPLHMTSTMYNPPAALLPRIAAEEYERVPDRGMVRGVVHDENAWALGGVAGHAGVFSDADDLAILAQTMLNGGVYGSTRILSERAVVEMLTNRNQAFVGQNQGYGFELYQHWYMGALATPYTAGHTGFTGTDIVIDPTTKSFSILLTNAVHPSRSWGSTNPVRRAVTNDVARAIAVHPAEGPASWYSGMADASTATLTVPVALRSDGELDFALWYDTEPQSDILTLEVSRDGGSTWTTVPFSMHAGSRVYPTDGTVSGYDGHRWLGASADLPGGPGAVSVRWRFVTDTLYHGRGVYLDAIRVQDQAGTAFDERRPGDAAGIVAAGFAPSAD
ncbi:MAG TPA: serine hydrolase [Actinopolymorphaceae bacterium]|nr:serine hydrolase [Actinopolymorphaceae bacterium]